MKNLVFVIVTLSVLWSCGAPGTIDPLFRWPVSGNAEADSLLALFESIRRKGAPADSLRWIAGQLYGCAGEGRAGRVVLSRAMYCDARVRLSEHDAVEAEKLRRTALAMLDSAGDTYDFFRWKTLNRDSASCDNYRCQLEAARFFKAAGDVGETANRYNSMGCMMFEIGNRSRALEMFERAHELFNRIGDSLEATKVFMNIALASAPQRTDSILRALLADPLMRSNDTYRLHVLVNYYTATDSVRYMEEAVDVCRRSASDSVEFLPVFYAYLGDNYCRHGEPERGLGMLERALSIMPPDYSPEFKSKIYSGLSGAYLRMGRYRESALASAARDSLQLIVEDDARKSLLINADLRSEVETMENGWRMASERLRWIYISVILAVIVVALVVALILYRRSKLRSIEALEADLRFRESQQSAMAASAVLGETGRLINELSSNLSDIDSDDTVGKKRAGEMLKKIHLHNLTQEERDCFLKASDRAGAAFRARLAAAYPSLTERQVKIASWIAAGVDSAQIARIFNIDHLSVNKIRYRIRVKLGLGKGKSLDEFLRDFSLGG